MKTIHLKVAFIAAGSGRTDGNLYVCLLFIYNLFGPLCLQKESFPCQANFAANVRASFIFTKLWATICSIVFACKLRQPLSVNALLEPLSVSESNYSNGPEEGHWMTASLVLVCPYPYPCKVCLAV